MQAPPATLLKKRLWHRCFPVNFAKFLRTPFSQNTSRTLLLYLTSQTRQEIITTHILLNISRSKGNLTMKFVSLIEDNMRNIFPGKSHTEENPVPYPYPLIKNQSSTRCWPLAFTYHQASLQNKKWSGTRFPVSFLTLKFHISHF